LLLHVYNSSIVNVSPWNHVIIVAAVLSNRMVTKCVCFDQQFSQKPQL